MMRSKSVATIIAMASTLALVASTFSASELALAQEIALDVTKATGDKPFGGEMIGTVTFIPDGHVVAIKANLTTPPDEGKVWEGWLVDAGGSGYKLSLGEFAQNGTLYLKEQMVNPYTYTEFQVTQEPFEDADPNAAAASGGAQLQTPFGR
jgi:hypothetical protein